VRTVRVEAELSPQHREKRAIHGEDVGDAEAVEHSEMNRIRQCGPRSTPALLDGAPSLFQIGGRNALDEDVAMREPGAGNLVAESDSDQLVCGRQCQICRKEVEAAGDEVLVGGDRRGM